MSGQGLLTGGTMARIALPKTRKKAIAALRRSAKSKPLKSASSVDHIMTTTEWRTYSLGLIAIIKNLGET